MDKPRKSTNVARWLSYSDRLLATGRAFHNVVIPRSDKGVSDVPLLGYSLLARTCSNFSGVITLIRAALVIEARTLARSCIEDSFYIVGLLQDGSDFVREMAQADVASKDVRGQVILERSDLKEKHEVFDEHERRNVQDFLKDLRQHWPKAGSIEPRKLAKRGSVSGGYLIYSQLSADSAHPSITSLNRYVTLKDGTATLNFSGPLSNEELVDTLTWASVGSLAAFIAGSELLQATELNEKLATLADEYSRLANAT